MIYKTSDGLFDPVGHYNRPDVFRLVVDDRPKPHLITSSGGGARRR
jgi:nitrilase